MGQAAAAGHRRARGLGPWGLGAWGLGAWGRGIPRLSHPFQHRCLSPPGGTLPSEKLRKVPRMVKSPKSMSNWSDTPFAK